MPTDGMKSLGNVELLVSDREPMFYVSRSVYNELVQKAAIYDRYRKKLRNDLLNNRFIGELESTLFDVCLEVADDSDNNE